MRVLVTGGAGFIGSHLTDRLVADGHTVTVVDDFSHGRSANVDSALGDSCRLEVADVTDPAFAELVVATRPEVIYHLAAQIDVRASVADPVQDAHLNVLGTVRTLEAAREAGVRKVVLASSVAIYGPVQQLPVTESTPTQPLSPYAVSKLTGEMYLRQYNQLHGLAGTTLCFGNVYGPRQDPHGEAGVVSIFSDALLAGRPTMVPGDGGNTRDYVYVGDVADALVRAGGDAGADRRYNIGTGVATSDLELHRAVAAAAGAAVEPSFGAWRPGDLRAMTLDSTRAATELGWRPSTPLRAGIEHTVAWARDCHTASETK